MFCSYVVILVFKSSKTSAICDLSLLVQVTQQTPSFLDSDPASVLRNVGVPQKAGGDVKARAKPAPTPEPTIKSEKTENKADSYSDSDLGRYD